MQTPPLRSLDSIFLVSDAHLLGPDDPGLPPLCAAIAAAQTPAVGLLGDLLHAGWTWRRPSAADRVRDAILEAVGDRLALVCPGNHDFGLRWPTSTQLCVRDVHHIVVGATRAALVHGDAADRRRGYRLTRRVLQSAAFVRLINMIGPDYGQQMLDTLAGAPGADPRRVDAALVAAQRTWAAAQLGPLDLVVMGHSHHLGIEQHERGALLWLGSWVGQRSAALLDGAGPRVLRPA